MRYQVITESDISRLPQGSPCYVLKGSIVTPLARELAGIRQITIYECETQEDIVDFKAIGKRIALACDAPCMEAKAEVAEFLEADGYLVIDCGDGSQSVERCPPVALRVALAVKAGEASRAILIENAGAGSQILVNKIPGIRATLCFDRLSAKNSRSFDDTNYLVLSLEFTSVDQMKHIISTWLKTGFDEKNQMHRLTRIEELENHYSKEILVTIPGDCSCAL
jgi:ribose 5-phosphate isomerase B